MSNLYKAERSILCRKKEATEGDRTILVHLYSEGRILLSF